MIKYQDSFEADNFFHVFNHTVGNENLFRNEDNFNYFLKKFNEHTHIIWDTYSYCLIPNHFHFLVKVKHIEELQKLDNFSEDVHKFVMQKLSNFLNGYAKAYNIKYKRKGALFLDFTKRIIVKENTYFSTLVNYIHQNPIHHGFCKNQKSGLILPTMLFYQKKKQKSNVKKY